MSQQRTALPPRVHAKGRWYYLVTLEAGKRKWAKLTRIVEGIPALYRKLADLHARDIAPDKIPALVVDWKKEVGATRAKRTQTYDAWLMDTISECMAEFRASETTPPDWAEFLKQFADKKRTYNGMRTAARELMRFAEEKGFRSPGTNPLDSIRTKSIQARQRYVTDSELRRIKVAAHYGLDGNRTRSGPMLCELINLAYLTGQRVSDLIDVRWSRKSAVDAQGNVTAPYIDEDGIYFKPSKTAGTTGAKVLIAWTPALKATIERIENIGRRNMHWVVTTQDAQPYTYWGVSIAWRRAVKRSGVTDCHFHDLRAKALTDKEDKQGMQAARRMGAHSTESQTADYVRHRKAQKTEATR
jgi:integrase